MFVLWICGGDGDINLYKETLNHRGIPVGTLDNDNLCPLGNNCQGLGI